jgi:hypothetical protein
MYSFSYVLLPWIGGAGAAERPNGVRGVYCGVPGADDAGVANADDGIEEKEE